MPKYLIQAKISHEGLKGTMAEGGSARHTAVKKAVTSMGGTLESFYYAFGENDIVGIAEMPSNAAMASFASNVALAGTVSAFATTPLLEPSEVDEAITLKVDYTPPKA